MNLLDFQSFYLVGIKGVAMTSLAQILIDTGKTVTGSDVAEDFPTKVQLDRLGLQIGTEFKTPLPSNVDCVVYTGAHGGATNPQVVWAQKNNISTISQAQALAYFFNQKQGIAVCGVGGKSTVSAMITWILAKDERNPSFSVGVGDIPGLGKTGAWTDSKYFVAEADEYVEDPSVKAEKITPRFAYLKPFITVCPNIRFDHPDVYKDFEHTKQVFGEFFSQTDPAGALIVNGDDPELVKLAKENHDHVLTFGENEQNDFQLTDYLSQAGSAQITFRFQDKSHQFSLKLPGKFNALNALASIATASVLDAGLIDSNHLAEFQSTARRFENMGIINGVQCYDDYAHHPHEVKAAIEALSDWYPTQRKVVAFQSHTYSRTKQLFAEFVDAFAGADEVLMTDIFSSAREKNDPTISSTILCEAIEKKHGIKAINLKTNEKLAEYFKENLKAGDVFLTLGAGDIYEIYELIK